MPRYQREWYQEVSRVNFAVSFYVGYRWEYSRHWFVLGSIPLNYRKQLLFTFLFFLRSRVSLIQTNIFNYDCRCLRLFDFGIFRYILQFLWKWLTEIHYIDFQVISNKHFQRHLRTTLKHFLQQDFSLKRYLEKSTSRPWTQFHTVFTRIFEFSKCTREIAKQVG